MGIKDLSKFLHDKYPEVFEHIHMSEYHFRRVAIDTSLYLCNYKALYGEEGWLGAFIKLVACLRENEIHCVFIYDSGFPPEKEAERKERSDSRRKLEERVCRLEDAVDKYHSSGEIDEILLEFQAKRKITQPRMLKPSSFGETNNINIHAIEYAVKKMRKQLFSVSAQDFAVTKQLFDILEVPYFNAPLEAETMCADLCIQGKVDAVLSEDTDVLAYGAPTFLTKVNTIDGTCMRIKHNDVLEKMGMTADEFLDFCIMCGTDYNKNIFKVGPIKAQKLIETHRSIDAIAEKTNLDISILNHKRVRQLFREYQKSQEKVPYCGCPNFNGLQQFVVKKNLRVNIESLRKSFVHNVIVFEEDKPQPEDDEEEVIILEDDED
jgi:5'-3' exonuclease